MVLRRPYPGIFLISLASLMLEVTLTRIFSALLYSDYAFMAISLALFGFGVSGLYAYLFPKKFPPEMAGQQLMICALLFGLTSFIVLLIIINVNIGLSVTAGDILRLLTIYVVSAIPFFFSGLCISLAMTHCAQQISTLYFSDLIGASAGCMLVIPMLNWLGAPGVILLASSIALLATLAFSVTEREHTKSIWLREPTFLLFALFMLMLFFDSRQGLLRVAYTKGEAEPNYLFTKWNSLSRVTVMGDEAAESLFIHIDAGAATIIYRNTSEQDLENLQELKKKMPAFAYHLKPEGEVLIIGPGGGSDVLTATLFGARHVTGADINPIIVNDVMRGAFSEYSGYLYAQPGVDVYTSEGRNFLHRTKNQYDVIQLTVVDTWAATAAGAFALSENNLYTQEAFLSYINHLTPDGVLSFCYWWDDPPSFVLRLASVGMEAMRQLGVNDPQNHIMMIREKEPQTYGAALSTLLIKRSSFRPEEVALIENQAAELGFEVVYTPQTQPPNQVTELITGANREEFYRTYPLDVSPPVDNRPFFFYLLRFRDLLKSLVDLSSSDPERKEAAKQVIQANFGTVLLLALAVITLVLTSLFILLPLIVLRRQSLRERRGEKVYSILYFASLGAGFITIEIALLQKLVLFLGHPVYALSVVLFSLLLFSGLGSYVTGRFNVERLDFRLKAIIISIAAVVGLYAVVVMPLLIKHLIGQSFGLKVFISVSMLGVLGFLMGMPFPTGIKYISRPGGIGSDLIPWAWGVNGAASVLGSVVAIIIAINFGFNIVLGIGVAVYLFGLAMMIMGARVHVKHASRKLSSVPAGADVP